MCSSQKVFVVCVSHLFVNLCKLVQVILKKGNLLLLGARPPAIIRLQFGTLQRGPGSRKVGIKIENKVEEEVFGRK